MPTSPRPDPVEYTIAESGPHTTVAVILDGIHIVTSGQPQYTEVTTLLREADTTDTVVRARLLGLITGAITPGEATTETTEQESTADDTQAESVQRGRSRVTTTIRLSDRFTIEAGQLVASAGGDGDADGQGTPVGGSLPDLIMALAAGGSEQVRLAALLALAERLIDTQIIDTAPEVAEHLWDWVTDNRAGITTNGRILGYMATVGGPIPGSYGVAVAGHRGRIAGRVVGSDQLDGLGNGPIATVIVDPADILEVPRGAAGGAGLVVTRVQIVTITPGHATGELALDPDRPLNRLGVQTLDLAQLTSTPHSGGGGGGEDVPDDPDESDDHETALCTECPCDCECDGGCDICRCCD